MAGMTVAYDSDGSMLIQADATWQRELDDLQHEDDFDSEAFLVSLLEPLTSSSELQWITPADTGDLTDAPMLGILGDQARHGHLPAKRYGSVLTGADEHGRWYAPVLARWAWMSYEVKSLQRELLEKGSALLSSRS